MFVDVAFHAFDYVIAFVLWKFINWIFDNEIIIWILALALLLKLMSQTWGFIDRFSEHWKLHKLERSSKSTDFQ